MPWWKKEEPEELDESDLPLNSDEAESVSTLIEAANLAMDAGPEKLAKLCLKEAEYILKRGRQEDAPVLRLVTASPHEPSGEEPSTKTQTPEPTPPYPPSFL